MKKAVLVSFLLVIAFNANAAQKIKHCGSNGKSEVREALNFVKNNLETIMDDTSGMTSKEKRNFERKRRM